MNGPSVFSEASGASYVKSMPKVFLGSDSRCLTLRAKVGADYETTTGNHVRRIKTMPPSVSPPTTASTRPLVVQSNARDCRCSLRLESRPDRPTRANLFPPREAEV